ncbi:MAG: biotin transporter BioY [Ruminococcaceae bacterium]|nr:biotin transporter BioY [Oscillospiraceae bacterium]
MKHKLFTTRETCYIALFAAVIAVSAWIAIPAAISFTMQTFAVFCAVGLLGTKCAVASILTYIVIGAAGLPVFTGFVGGIGIFATVNGGFILGFIPAALVCGTLIKKGLHAAISMGIGLLVCYFFGSAWFCILSGGKFLASVQACVLPFIPFDIIKISLAAFTVKKLKKHI